MAADGAEVKPLEEWQHLSSSSSPSSSPPLPKWHNSLLIHNNYVFQVESTFHPSLHENLDHVPQPQHPLLSSPSFVDSTLDNEQQQLVVMPLDNESKEDGFRELYPWSCSLLGEILELSAIGHSSGAWARVSVSTTTGIIAVVVMSWAYAKLRKLKCLRLKRSRATEESVVVENLVLLVKQKEERISQLTLQISRMNKVTLAQLQVPALRVS